MKADWWYRGALFGFALVVIAIAYVITYGTS